MLDHRKLGWLEHVRLFGRVLSFVVCSAILLIVANPLMSHFAAKENALATGAVAALGTYGLTIVFTKLDRWTLAQVGASFEWRSLLRAFYGFAIGLLIVAAWAAALYVIQHVRWEPTPGIGLVATAVSVVMYLVLASREELAFRGYPLRRLQAGWGVWPAQLCIAAIFAVEHLLGGAFWVDALIGSALGSLLFGMAAIATDGLAVPIGIHAAWNTGHWALGLKSTPGLLQPVATEENGSAGYAVPMFIYAIIFGVATFSFWLLCRRRTRSTGADSDGK